MADADETVFLSYRREVSWAMAHLVRNDLVEHGFDVFMDVGSIDSGEFERVILARIQARAHFLVLIEPRSLERIAESGDWLCREIAHALAHRRNVVPVLANGARMPRAADLPPHVQRLPRFNAVSVPHDYFAEAMQKLRVRFLRAPEPPRPPSPPVADVTAAVRRRRAVTPAARPAGDLSAPALTVTTEPEFTVLRWTRVGSASSYELAQSPTPDFVRSSVLMRGEQRRCIAHPTTVLRGRWFRVRAIGVEPATPGPWSDSVAAAEPSSVVMRPLSGLHDLLAPRLLAESGPLLVDLTWTAVPGATAYVVEGASNTLFPSPREVYRGTATAARELLGRSSCYRVRFDVKGTAGPWSEVVRPRSAP